MSPHKVEKNAMDDARVRSFADSTAMLLISRVGMAFGAPLVIIMMVWVVSSVNALQIAVGVMKEQIETGSADRYRASDAIKDLALRDARIDRAVQDYAGLAVRVEQVERRQLGAGFRP